MLIFTSGAMALAGCASNAASSGATSNGAVSSDATATPLAVKTIDDYTQAAIRFGDVVEVPRFETTPEEVAQAVDRTLAEADRRLDELAKQNLQTVTFRSTIAALDDITYPVTTLTNRLWLMKETQPDPALRDACTEQVRRLQEWFVSLQYREDVYKACKAFAEAYEAGRRGRLEGEDLKLFEETMRDYRRAGLALDPETRKQVEALQKELANVSTDFDTNITNADVTVVFTKEELEGVPESFLERVAQPDGTYAVKATVTPQFIMVMENAKREATRKRMKIARYTAAMKENSPVLDEMVRLRDEIASLLGYESWDDYQIEVKMAKTGARAKAFVEDLARRLEPKFQQELEAMRQLKVAETGDENAQIHHWDWRYYANQLRKKRYNVDTEQLRNYFPLDRVVQGLFSTYERIFGLRFEPVQPPQKWVNDLTLHMVLDAKTGEPLGLFYLDLFPRPGKYNHFAQFDVVGGKQLRDGRYVRPVAALVCNFTPPTDDAPSLLSHDEVETFFHEFGHAMHTILTRARYARFAGTNVPRDFVEAPSQMLERWVWDADVLNTFAADWRDPSKKIDPALIARMDEARKATIATFYRRQLAFALADLRLHDAGRYKDSRKIVNDTLAEIFLPAPEGTNFAAYWGHMSGYDAGYYGYAWADAISADLATAFRSAPKRFFDEETGMRLRREIYEVGGSRDVEESIRAFLGRDWTLDAFLEELGVPAEPGHANTLASPSDN